MFKAGSVRKLRDGSLNGLIIGTPMILREGRAIYQFIPLRSASTPGFVPTPEDIEISVPGDANKWYASLWEFGPVVTEDLIEPDWTLEATSADKVRIAYDRYVRGEEIPFAAKPVSFWKRNAVARFRKESRARRSRVWERARNAVVHRRSFASAAFQDCRLRLTVGKASTLFVDAAFLPGAYDLVEIAKLYHQVLANLSHTETIPIVADKPLVWTQLPNTNRQSQNWFRPQSLPKPRSELHMARSKYFNAQIKLNDFADAPQGIPEFAT